ncbi:contractile injection system protein, VgrG/Pvc8 family [Mangrovibacter sp. SLW1]
MVHFADRQSAWSFGKKLPLNSPSGANDNGADSVWDVQVTQNVAVRSVTTGDYNHREAQRVLLSEPADMTRGDGEGVTWGMSTTTGHGTRRAEIALTRSLKLATSGRAWSTNAFYRTRPG